MSKHHKAHHSDHSGAHARATSYHMKNAGTVGNAESADGGNSTDLDMGASPPGAASPPMAPPMGGGDGSNGM